MWPPASPDLKPMVLIVQSLLETKVCSVALPSVDALKTSLLSEQAKIPPETSPQTMVNRNDSKTMQSYDPSQSWLKLGYHRELTERRRKDAGMTYPCNQTDVGNKAAQRWVPTSIRRLTDG